MNSSSQPAGTSSCGSPGAAFSQVSGAARNLETRLAGAGLVGDNLGTALDKAREDALYAQLLFLFLGVPGAVLAALVTASIAAAGADRRRRDAALLRTRGASTQRLVRLALAEAALAGVVGIAVGLCAALAIGSALFGIAVHAVASAQRAYEITLAYAGDREAFGQPIGKFQVNRHALAEMRTKIDVMRTYLDQCVLAVNAGELTAEEAEAWLTALNDLRLVLGTRLDVREDTFADGLDALHQAEHHAQPFVDHPLVVGDEHPNHAGTASSTRNPWPVGPALRVPPSSSARSRIPVSP